MNFEEVSQGEFPGKPDGTAFDLALEKFVFDQGFAHVPDADMRILHLPDLTVLERWDGDGDAVFPRRVLHGHQCSKAGIRREENRSVKPARPGQDRAPRALKESLTFSSGDARHRHRHHHRRAAGPHAGAPR